MGGNALLPEISNQVQTAVQELLQRAQLEPGSILVVGCSTSEVQGKCIGSRGNRDVAAAILQPLLKVVAENQIHLALQCCEHLNRALVVERVVLKKYRLEQVAVYPVDRAGGSLAALAMDVFQDPVLVESIEAHAGLDIGHTLIGMHIKPVAVPTRLSIDRIGEAHLVAARFRPRLIGGLRAVYTKPGTPPLPDEK
jgi:uncharacterized protein (TIGR01440 family)